MISGLCFRGSLTEGGGAVDLSESTFNGDLLQNGSVSISNEKK